MFYLSILTIYSTGNINLIAYCDILYTEKKGHIVNIGSVAGFLGVFGYTAYGASKFALHGYTESLRSELQGYGINVSLVCPPDTDTPMLEEENKYKMPELIALSKKGGIISAEKVAHCTIRGMAGSKFLILPGFESRYINFASRHFPRLTRLIMDREIRNAGRRE